MDRLQVAVFEMLSSAGFYDLTGIPLLGEGFRYRIVAKVIDSTGEPHKVVVSIGKESAEDWANQGTLCRPEVGYVATDPMTQEEAFKKKRETFNDKAAIVERIEAKWENQTGQFVDITQKVQEWLGN